MQQWGSILKELFLCFSWFCVWKNDDINQMMTTKLHCKHICYLSNLLQHFMVVKLLQFLSFLDSTMFRYTSMPCLKLPNLRFVPVTELHYVSQKLYAFNLQIPMLTLSCFSFVTPSFHSCVTIC